MKQMYPEFVMICLGDQMVKEENLLLGMLDTLFKSDLDADEKKRILEEEYHLPMSERMESEVSRMCNYSDGIEQRGIEKGIAKGIQQAKIENAKNLLDVLSDEIIAEKIGLSLEKVKELRAQNLI